MERLGKVEPLQNHADDQAPENVHEQDQDRGDRVSADKLAGTVHRPVEFRLS